MASCSSHGAWQYQPAANFIRRFYGCPLLDAAYVSQHRHARLNASAGLLTLPRFSSCSSPPRFDAQRFLDRLAGRTLALVGDSVTEQHFHSVACALFAHDATRVPSWWPSNATADELWKSRSCLPFGDDDRPFFLCLVTAAKLNEAAAPDWVVSERLRTALGPADVVVLNAGVHFSDAEVAARHVGMLAGPLLNTSARSVAPPLVIYAETAPQHFSGGRYPPDDPSLGCVPLAPRCAARCNGYNQAARPLARELGVPILPLWAASAALHSEHPAGAKRDCTHWILPGVQLHWSELLSGLLLGAEGVLARPLDPLATPAKRWRALRGVFKTLAGCLYHTHRRDTNTSCCTTACREAVLPFSPPAHPHHSKFL